VSAVEQEVGAIAGVTGVHVDLDSGQVTVTSTRPLDHEDVSAAIDEAGYELAT
jgi:copper chaperone CopZ